MISSIGSFLTYPGGFQGDVECPLGKYEHKIAYKGEKVLCSPSVCRQLPGGAQHPPDLQGKHSAHQVEEVPEGAEGNTN